MHPLSLMDPITDMQDAIFTVTAVCPRMNIPIIKDIEMDEYEPHVSMYHYFDEDEPERSAITLGKGATTMTLLKLLAQHATLCEGELPHTDSRVFDERLALIINTYLGLE